MNALEDQHNALRQLLRAAGLRATVARVQILHFLDSSPHPLSHSEVFERLSSYGMEKSTVFRALTDLTDVGLLRKMELGDHVWRFERTSNSEGSRLVHPHLLCIDCGQVECLNETQVQLTAVKSIGPIEDVLLKGHCKDCR